MEKKATFLLQFCKGQEWLIGFRSETPKAISEPLASFLLIIRGTKPSFLPSFLPFLHTAFSAARLKKEGLSDSPWPPPPPPLGNWNITSANFAFPPSETAAHLRMGEDASLQILAECACQFPNQGGEVACFRAEVEHARHSKTRLAVQSPTSSLGMIMNEPPLHSFMHLPSLALRPSYSSLTSVQCSGDGRLSAVVTDELIQVLSCGVGGCGCQVDVSLS